jgi:hypothetical protein
VDPCTYIVGSKVLTPQCEQAFAGLCSLVSCSMLPPALVFSTGHPDDWLETGLPCRVHLLHGVFLI